MKQKITDLRNGQGGGAGEAWAEVESARSSLASVMEILEKSKSDRAQLVDYALKSLTSLSTHLSCATRRPTQLPIAPLSVA